MSKKNDLYQLNFIKGQYFGVAPLEEYENDFMKPCVDRAIEIANEQTKWSKEEEKKKKNLIKMTNKES